MAIKSEIFIYGHEYGLSERFEEKVANCEEVCAIGRRCARKRVRDMWCWHLCDRNGIGESGYGHYVLRKVF